MHHPGAIYNIGSHVIMLESHVIMLEIPEVTKVADEFCLASAALLMYNSSEGSSCKGYVLWYNLLKK